MNRPQEGLQYTHSAIATYEQMGDRINAARARTDLLYIYVQSREFQAVTQIGPEVYQYHQALQDRYNSAVDAHNLAKAWFELSDLDRSERYAQESLAFNEKAAIPYALYNLGRIRSRQDSSRTKPKITSKAPFARRNRMKMSTFCPTVGVNWANTTALPNNPPKPARHCTRRANSFNNWR